MNINNGNRIEWSPIRSVINTSDYQNRLHSGSPFCLMTSMNFTDRIGQHKVLLQILIITTTKIVIF